MSDIVTVNAAATALDEVVALSAEDFRTRYALPATPVILRGFLTDWPCRRWSIEALTERFASCAVDVMYGPAKIEQDRAIPYPERRTMTMGDFATALQSSEPAGYLVAQSQLLQRPEFATLWDDITLRSDWFNVADAPTGVSLWIGPAGTVTPMHYDTQDVLLAQLSGSKRVLLADKAQSPWMYAVDGSGYSRVDPESPDLGAFPLFHNVSLWDATIHSGDALFLPSGWWHHVRSLSSSISLSLSNFAWTESRVINEPARQAAVLRVARQADSRAL